MRYFPSWEAESAKKNLSDKMEIMIQCIEKLNISHGMYLFKMWRLQATQSSARLPRF